MFDLHTNNARSIEFPKSFDWINTDKHFTFSELYGHIIVLDFWTYCCINCIHMIPILHDLKQKYVHSPVFFIGIHSGKFLSEQITKNIENAVLRYDITHPIIVDKEMTIWEKFNVNAWPTIIIIDPQGNIVYKQSGENQKNQIDTVIETLLQIYSKKNLLSKTTINLKYVPPAINSTLHFPGKISILDGNIAISDSNNNRILILSKSHKIQYVIGNGNSDLIDGTFLNASFSKPQGLIWYNTNIIFVADTNNNAIRKIDLQNNLVTTLCSNQNNHLESTNAISLSSPWDLSIYNNILYIAMAGKHQIWSYDINTKLLSSFAGNGYENLVDGDIRNAQLAQPSGLSILDDSLYFVDSETSSIRVLDLKTQYIKTIVGKGLFDFGFLDGDINSALFQHPLGICATSNSIFIADTYNSAIRKIDLHTKITSTLIATQKKNNMCYVNQNNNTYCNTNTLSLYEPNDVKFFNDNLYIADTNNHMIRIYDLKSCELSILNI